MPSPAADRLEELLSGLNEPQRAAVTSPDGPLLILAGAGSGKTRVLTHRLAWLVHSGRLRHDEVLAITFTNKAAQEMRERVELLLGRRTQGMWVMTFHAACARMLRAEAPKLGYTRQFTIYDQSDARRMTKRCLDEHGHDTKRYTPSAIYNQISDSKNKLRDPEAYRQLVGSRFEEVVADVYESYEREMHRMNAMDFDDLLVRSVNVLELFQEVRDRYSSTFQHVLVDEYQDTNHAQYRWLQLLAGEHRNLAVVGDDAQCLVEGTAVTMGDGTTRPIEEIAPGDEVRSCFGSGDFRPSRVTRVHRSERVDGIAITLRGGQRIVSTPEHTHFAGHRVGLTPQLHMASVTLCDDRRGRTPVHNIAIGGHDDAGREALESLGLTVRPTKAGSPSWRYESAFTDFGQLWKVAEEIQDVLDVTVRCRARFGTPRTGEGNSLPFTHASAVRPGMAMFTEDGRYDIVESVERVILDRPVYDLDVEHTHNFVAEGIVTHNSVYSFRGADIRNILDFQDDYPDATTIKLEQNYRSTQTILDAANAVIRNNRGQIAKDLWTELGEGDPIRVRELDDERAEARFVTGDIERMIDDGASRQEIAVFYRTNAQSRVLEDELRKRDIGYQVIGGPKFYDRAEVKDAIAYLAWLANPQDVVAFSRIVNSPRRGIGQTSMARVTGYAQTMGISAWEAAEDPSAVPGLGTAAVKAFTRFMDTMAGLRERAAQNVPIADLLNAVLSETGYLDALEAERTFEAQGRIDNLEALVDAAAEFDASAEPAENTLDVFLQEKALVADADSRADEGLVTLMTLHNAKGLEYDVVYVTGFEDGVFPHSRALDEGTLEEERRLCYVGITRARRELTLSYARQRMVFGSTTYGLRSRFLDEIPVELTDREVSNDIRAGSGGIGVPRISWAASRSDAPADDTNDFRLGEDVVHSAFGEGVVVGIEPGGIVVIRFAKDASERKLMAEYAPIKRR
ncbi:MAG: family ATPase [Solirubrobacterales bacterium]|nr:family ATPase [Solirubrobacterales bacterium]